MLPVFYLGDSCVIVTLPINHASQKKDLQLVSLFLYYFFVLFEWSSTGAEVGRNDFFAYYI